MSGTWVCVRCGEPVRTTTAGGYGRRGVGHRDPERDGCGVWAISRETINDPYDSQSDGAYRG